MGVGTACVAARTQRRQAGCVEANRGGAPEGEPREVDATDGPERSARREDATGGGDPKTAVRGLLSSNVRVGT